MRGERGWRGTEERKRIEEKGEEEGQEKEGKEAEVGRRVCGDCQLLFSLEVDGVKTAKCSC